MRSHRLFSALLSLLLCSFAARAPGQSTGTLRGTIALDANGAPLHRASITIVQLRLGAESNDEGVYEITGLPPGTYDVTVHMESLSDERQRVEVTAGGVATVDFRLRISPVREQITVTASGREQATIESFQSVTVAKRSFGPGSSRPVIRGFDGDRVLILQDGMQIGRAHV